MRKEIITLLIGLGFVSALAAGPGWGEEVKAQATKSQSAKANNTELAKASQNPIANMISLPLQNNTSFKIGPRDRTQNVFNIQPVIPVNLSEDWTLINRTICPLIYQPFVTRSSGGMFGLGDINHTVFLSPAQARAVVWGVGPIVSFPTATDEILGTGKWLAGPSAVLVTTLGPWVIGAVANNLWDFAGQSSRAHINQFLIQPFINYNLANGWYLSSAPIITSNWKADSSDRWLVPVGGGGGKVFPIAGQHINVGLQAYYNVEKPSGGPEWSTRLVVTLLFPTD